MAEMGREPFDDSDGEVLRVIHSHASRDVLAWLFPDPDQFDRALAAARRIDYRELVPLMVMEDGYRETLDRLAGKYDLAVCTNRSSSVEAVLDAFGIREYFGLVITAARVPNPKPHPDPLHAIIDHYRISPRELLFIGDSEVDYQAATAAGVPFVGYRNTFPHTPRIDHHLQLIDFLDGGITP
jgi:HAD superfamily hydrolase (TIGR01509 family)